MTLAPHDPTALPEWHSPALPSDVTDDPHPSTTDPHLREHGTAHLSGIAALVRMIIDRARLDRRIGTPTASFVSGYEGSPLAGYDLALARRRDLLDAHLVTHRPGLNEELAATSVMGSQLAATVTGLHPDLHTGGARDIVGYWYGKAPGLDRATDALRHANIVRTHPDGGAVAVVGDDPGAKSSTVPSASEAALADLAIPVLYPADPADILDLGVHAAHMSRSSGVWTALKVAAHVADGSATLRFDGPRRAPTLGDLGRSEHVPSGRLLGAGLMELERSLHMRRLPRAIEYARVNGLNRITVASSDDRIGIIAAGKSYLDVREGLRLIGISDADLHRLGIRILKLGMIFPLEESIIDRFVGDTASGGGLSEIIVVEEKHDFLESLIRNVLYRRPGAPRVVGKTHEDGTTLFARFGELDIDAVTTGLATRLGAHHHIEPAQRWQETRPRRSGRIELPLTVRTPYFCSGCPHNSSTKVPDANDRSSLVGAGIGCHAMVLLMDPEQVGDVVGTTQMGGEGGQWIGMAPFVADEHFVQNLGDGTFMHSGSLAVRAAVAAGVNVTFKLLHNQTVAMTGGQDAVGARGLGALLDVLNAEGVARIVVTTDDVRRTRRELKTHGRAGVTVADRSRIIEIQQELAAIAGVTVLVHDQGCAAEKRRKRRRGKLPTPATRVVINERICEGCGDCGEKSNCLSVHPVTTEFGRKTRIDQGSCNLDMSCLDGDCPSFVTVTPSRHDKPAVHLLDQTQLPTPPRWHRTHDAEAFSIRITGIGGTGVVTLSQIIATAASFDGQAARTVDMTGLAQKGGAVVSDLKLTREPVEQAAKVSAGACDLYLVCDRIVGADPAHLRVTDAARTMAVVSTVRTPTGAMVVDTRRDYPDVDALDTSLAEATARSVHLDADRIASRLCADPATANMVLAGAAYQAGALPVSATAIEEAIGLNGVAVVENTAAFRRGRQAVADPAALEAALADTDPTSVDPGPPSVAATDAVRGAGIIGRDVTRTVALRYDDLCDYADTSYATQYLALVAEVAHADPSTDLTDAVARHLHKLMAYKDEYEVARLAGDPRFVDRLHQAYGREAKVSVRLHPPLLRAMGVRHKIGIGARTTPLLRMLARAKRLRGSILDPFGRTEVRRTERALITEYRDLVARLIDALRAGRIDPDNMAEAVELASLPDMVRGYESIKMARVVEYRRELERRSTALNL